MPTLAELAGFSRDDPSAVGGGLLGLLLSFVDERKKGLLANIQNPGQFAENTKQGLLDWSKKMAFDASAQQSVMPQMREYGADQMTNNAMNMGGLLGMTAYHGSPHLFDKFDMSKIGTGEGAQAYGHGLYFAENPAVAGEYRNALSNWVFDGQPLRNVVSSFPDSAMQIAHKQQITIGDAAKIFDKDRDLRKVLNTVQDYGASVAPRFLDDGHKELLKQLQGTGRLKPESGGLYKVDIPDEHVAKMLDWDKPLSQQPKNVQDVFLRMAQDPKTPFGSAMKHYGFDKDDMLTGMTGRRLYDFMGGDNVRNYKASAERLKELGIPGIKYLDGGSREGGKGTSNFVLFDDQIPKIIGRE